MTRRTRTPWIVGAAIFLVTWGLTTHGKYSSSGDEPHYLIVAHSLVVDGDLDLRNNYAQDDGRQVGHAQLEAGAHARTAADGRLLSTHDPGLSVFLAPVYWIAHRAALASSASTLARFRMDQGLFAYSLVSLFLIAVSAASIALAFSALTAGPRVPPYAALAATAVALSPPALSHMFLVFPEVAAFAVTAVVVWFLFKPAGRHDATMFLILAVALGLLPWFHRKYSPYVLGLLVLMLWKRPDIWRRRPPTQLAAGLAAFVLPQAAFYAWTWFEWRNIGGPQMLEGLPFSAAALKNGLFGLVFDREYGLLAYAPVYLLLPACWWLTRRRTAALLLPVLMLYLPMAAFVVWWGGFAPAARYLVPLVPLFLVPMVWGLDFKAVRIAMLILLVPQLVIDGYVWQHPRTLWPLENSINPALDKLGPIGRWYEAALPSLRGDYRASQVVVAFCLTLIFTAVVVWRAKMEGVRST